LTRFVYDRFSKDYLETLFSQYGTAETAKTVAPEVLEIDVYFTPNSPPQAPPELGLLGKFAQTIALFEPYRNPVTRAQILDCLTKLSLMRQLWLREAHRQKQKFPEVREPQLWILTPTLSSRIIRRFQADLVPEYGEGVYFLPTAHRAALVVLHRLLETPETLWLRILGRGTVQARAIDELEALPTSHPFKTRTLELLYNLSRNLETNKIKSEEDRRLVMRLAPLYQQDRELAFQQGIEQGIERGIEQGIERGIEQGIVTGKQNEAFTLILRQLTRRIGEIPVNLVQQIRLLPLETLENLAEVLLDFQTEADLREFLHKLI